MRTLVFILCMAFVLHGCTNEKRPVTDRRDDLPDQFLVILGIAQDAGYPQIGCEKECCTAYWSGKTLKKHVTSFAIVDRIAGQYWLFEATPDISRQLTELRKYLPVGATAVPAGIFITHAHIGHYTGLMYFGREAMGATGIPVWAMPRMAAFLRENGPWSQLVQLQNIQVHELKGDSAIQIGNGIAVIPVKVPHRDEFSETAGFEIRSRSQKILFIPDIDKWEKWDRDITDLLGKTDLALLDGTFYKNGELPGRDMREVPHPFIEESVALFSMLPEKEKSKIHFIHFNHTNPVLEEHSRESRELEGKGFRIAREGMVIAL